MNLKTFYTALLLFCFLQTTAFAATVEVYNFFSDDESSISLSFLSVAFSDIEEEDSTEHDGEEKEGEEKENADADEEEYCYISSGSKNTAASQNYLQGHYLQSDYSVDLYITVEPPKLD